MNIQFFTPQILRGVRTTEVDHDVYIIAALNGKDRKTTNYTVNVKQLLTKNKKNWQYVAVGINDGGDIVLTEGSKENGYFIAVHNKDICNKILVTSLVQHLGERPPTKSNDVVKIYMKATYDKINNCYILTKIR